MTEAHEMGLPKKLVKNTTQLVKLLQEKYPAQQWAKMFTVKGRFRQQRRLEQAVAALFPVLPNLPPPSPQHLVVDEF